MLDNVNIKRKNPVNRNNMFFSKDDMNLQMAFGREYVNNVVNQTVILYQVDLEKTKVDNIYNEAKFEDLIFKTPVEINVLYNLDKAELKNYDTTKLLGYYAKTGKLSFSVYEEELKDNDCDIRRGDYIGLQVTPEKMEYFIVTDDGRVNYDNRHTMFGTVPYYRSVSCSVVSDITETKSI